MDIKTLFTESNIAKLEEIKALINELELDEESVKEGQYIKIPRLLKLVLVSVVSMEGLTLAGVHGTTKLMTLKAMELMVSPSTPTVTIPGLKGVEDASPLESGVGE